MFTCQNAPNVLHLPVGHHNNMLIPLPEKLKFSAFGGKEYAHRSVFGNRSKCGYPPITYLQIYYTLHLYT